MVGSSLALNVVCCADGRLESRPGRRMLCWWSARVSPWTSYAVLMVGSSLTLDVVCCADGRLESHPGRRKLCWWSARLELRPPSGASHASRRLLSGRQVEGWSCPKIDSRISIKHCSYTSFYWEDEAIQELIHAEWSHPVIIIYSCRCTRINSWSIIQLFYNLFN